MLSKISFLSLEDCSELTPSGVNLICNQVSVCVYVCVCMCVCVSE